MVVLRTEAVVRRAKGSAGGMVSAGAQLRHEVAVRIPPTPRPLL